jgi:hypothetical protein
MVLPVVGPFEVSDVFQFIVAVIAVREGLLVAHFDFPPLSSCQILPKQPKAAIMRVREVNLMYKVLSETSC